MSEIGKNRDINESKQPESTKNVEKIETSKEDINEAREKMENSLNNDIGNDKEQQKNPHVEDFEGKKYYYDDNGNIYRVDDELIANKEYEINGYKYKTDDKGRIISSEGKLHTKDRDGKLPIRDSIEKIGKGDEKEGDQRGHLIGDQFDGSNSLENLIPQDAEVNMKDYKNFENELAKEVKDGKDVTVKIEPVYEGDSRRPEAIVVTYSVNGEESVKVFPNNKER